ncbi:thioesterase II family protein [Umezawaea tangerina]|uniref:Surfactin synthase thioesterase subunit n=1 Tax=Umezawaea tangerina TaxID=84725 RepID=A0A2T0T7P9_9PSEU|nr:thioesterase domain-containing protein [Umezawaea tangerina]PRY41663.1 surfactin synthase thioesterase subunit [Umezawaea tangerina]
MTSGHALASPWFVRPPATSAPARLFCFPFSGSGASAFSAWPATAGDAEICPVQFPGRENRLAHPHYASYENLADQLVQALTPLLDTPFAFFGHCAGALPAYESALNLAAAGLPTPQRLFVSGQPAPHEAAHDRMLTLGEDDLRAELVAFLRGRGLEPRPDMIDMGMVVLLRDRAAAVAYRRTEPARLDCPITVLHWSQDTDVSLADLQGWLRYADSVEFHVVEGGHYDFMDAPAPLLQTLATRRGHPASGRWW